MRRLMLFLVICFLLLAVPAAAQESSPPWPTDGWLTATPESQGMDSAQLAAIFDRIATTGLDIHSVLVIRNGYLVLEAYRHPYTADMQHQINSCTKSITSALVGIAIEQGFIESVDQPVLDFFSDYTVANMDAAKEAITLEQLLTMSSGLDWVDELTSYVTLGEMFGSPDWVQFVLDRPMLDEPGQRFVYNSGGSQLLLAAVEGATGQDALSYARANLFEPLGIQTVTWEINPQGHYVGGRGLVLTPRDMAKFGYLYLNNGQWDGQQIIDADWMAASTQSYVAARPYAEGYGYQWWVDPLGYYMAAGALGQHIMVYPEKNLLVVFTGNLPNQSTFQPESLFQNIIVPAIKSDEALPENPDAQAALQVEVDALAHPTPREVDPLPETAIRISGQIYEFESNDLGWRAVSLTFTQGSDTALWVWNDQPPMEIGLDGLFRVNPQPDYPALFLKGRWNSDSRFVVQMEGPGLGTPTQLTFTFEGQDVTIARRDNTFGNRVTFNGTAQ